MSQKLLGYHGKLAYVNLSNKEVEVKDLDPKIAKDYLGGVNLSAKLIFDLLTDEDYTTLKEDQFSTVNPLVFATGPLTGTLRPSSGRYSVSGISPLTKMWGEGTSGGTFCIALKNSGFDAIILTGKAEKPIYLYINDGNIEFKDANNIWGKDCYESQELIKKELNNDKIKVATIGIAGENLVKYAGIINDEGRAIGRCGLGAIMGSKKLKALAILGGNRVEIANSAAIKEIRTAAEKLSFGDYIPTAASQVFTLYGTNSYLDIGMLQGDTPGYYFTSTEFLAEKLTGKTLAEEYPVFNYGCAGCTMRCGKTTVVNDNGKDIEVDGPEYESVAAFGPLCGVFDSKPVILANHYCNVHGFDTISGGVSIAFLIYLVENKLGMEKIEANLKDIKIEDIKWGNGDLVLKLVDKIAKREGIGDILAEGTRIMAEKLGVDPELAAHVKGLEIPMHEPRAFDGQALSYMTCCVGANHEKGDWFGVEVGTTAFPEFRARKGKGANNVRGRERGVKNLQDIRALDDSGINCNFIGVTFEDMIAYFNAATGFGYKKKSLIKVGERGTNVKRLISCNLGITREDDKLPLHFSKVFSGGKTAGVKQELGDNLERYYKERGWDWETGRPTEEKLKELEII